MLPKVGVKKWGFRKSVLFCPLFGVTSFLPTTFTADLTTLFKIIEKTKNWERALSSGARVLGLHLEGPYLSSGRRGAHDATCLRKPHEEGNKIFSSQRRRGN